MRTTLSFRSAVTLVAASFILVGCASNNDSDAAPDTETPASQAAPGGTDESPSTTTAPVSPTSSRGYFIKRVGELGGLTNNDGSHPIDFTVTDITVDPVCELSIAEEPDPGHHLVLVSLDVETDPSFEPDMWTGAFHPRNDWHIVDANGVTDTDPSSDAAMYCIDAEWPSGLAPGSKYQFRVVLDSRTPTGTLVLAPISAPDDFGWEWQFPA